MLTVDILKGNSKEVSVSDKIKALPDDVLAEIATLSKNDEDVIIGNKLKEVHEKYDKDVSDATGLTKAHNERSWDFLKRGIEDLKAKQGDPTLTKKVADLEAEKADLEKAIKEGKGNEALTKQLNELTRDLADAKKEVSTWKEKHKTDIEDREKKLTEEQKKSQQILVEAEFAKAQAGLKFKAEYSEEVVSSFVDNQKALLLKDTTVDFIDNGQGGKVMVFRDSKGEILRNKDNSLNPYTATELLQSKLTPILDPGKEKPGLGTLPPENPASRTNGTVRVQAKTQPEAMTQIRTHLEGMGLKKGSDEWQAAQDKAWADNKCSELSPQ